MKEDLEKLVNDGKLTSKLAIQYLTLFVGEDNWEEHIKVLYARIQKKWGADKVTEKFRRQLACAIMLPTRERNLDLKQPCKILFGADKFEQFDDVDWFERLREVARKDLMIQEFRSQLLDLGIIDPIEYQPYCRQAFNWLFERAEQAGEVNTETKEAVTKSMKNVVYRYGGMVVSNLFTRHHDKVDKVVNWRTGYFVERAIFNAYPNPETILKIKQAEILESPQKLVKKINNTDS